MAKVGDSVTVEIKGAPLGGTALSTASAEINIGPGAQMQVQGKIVEAHGAHWLVELTISVGGRNRILVPKAAEKGSLVGRCTKSPWSLGRVDGFA